MQFFSAERTSALINQNELQWEDVNRVSRICQDVNIFSTKSHASAFWFIENLGKACLTWQSIGNFRLTEPSYALSSHPEISVCILGCKFESVLEDR
jgi:hypothetical protein